MTCKPEDHLFVDERCEACGVGYFEVPERVAADDVIYNPELVEAS